MLGAGDDSFLVGLLPPGEVLQGVNAAAEGHVRPLLPGVSGVGLISVEPELLELIHEHVNRGQ